MVFMGNTNQYILTRYDGSTAKFSIEEIRQECNARCREYTCHPVLTMFNSVSLNEIGRAKQHNIALRQRKAHSVLSNLIPRQDGRGDYYMNCKDWETNVVYHQVVITT